MEQLLLQGVDPFSVFEFAWFRRSIRDCIRYLYSENMHSFRRIGFRSSRFSRSALRAAAGAAASSSYLQRVSGIQGVSKAAWTSGQGGLLSLTILQMTKSSAGILSALGDTLAQGLAAYYDQQQGKAGMYDPRRTARMFGFGLLWYGPYQFYWYNALEYLMPGRNVANFLTKVASNQLLLAPCTLTAVFSWNLICQGREGEIPGKLKSDLLPTMMNGWKFWIPAASLNFWIVPLHMQVTTHFPLEFLKLAVIPCPLPKKLTTLFWSLSRPLLLKSPPAPPAIAACWKVAKTSLSGAFSLTSLEPSSVPLSPPFCSCGALADAFKGVVFFLSDFFILPLSSQVEIMLEMIVKRFSRWLICHAVESCGQRTYHMHPRCRLEGRPSLSLTSSDELVNDGL